MTAGGGVCRTTGLRRLAAESAFEVLDPEQIGHVTVPGSGPYKSHWRTVLESDSAIPSRFGDLAIHGTFLAALPSRVADKLGGSRSPGQLDIRGHVTALRGDEDGELGQISVHICRKHTGDDSASDNHKQPEGYVMR
jgi:hypothetical protein